MTIATLVRVQQPSPQQVFVVGRLEDPFWGAHTMVPGDDGFRRESLRFLLFVNGQDDFLERSGDDVFCADHQCLEDVPGAQRANNAPRKV